MNYQLKAQSKVSKSLKVVATLTIILLFITISIINAQVDSTFGTNGVATADTGVTDKPIASFVLPDNKVLVVSRNDCCSTPNKVFFVRFNENGTIDSTYGNNGVIEVAIPYTISGQINGAVRQSDGKIIVVGNDGSTRGIIARYNEDATLDSSFGSGGFQKPNISQFDDDGLNNVLIQPDGKILAAGFASFGGIYPQLSLLRFNTNGSIDTSFGTSGTGFIFHSSIVLPFDDGSEIFTLQSTGKIIVGNRFETVTGGTYPTHTAINRFNTDGSRDNTFNTLSFPYHNIIGTLRCAVVQPDDKILVGNQVTKTDPLEIVHNDAAITRYNPDGTIDTSFGNAGQTSFYTGNFVGGYPIAIQTMADGQIAVAVTSTVHPNRSKISGTKLTLVRLSPTGTVNGNFIVSNSYYETRHKAFMSILPDGKILTTFRTYNDVMLVRVNGIPTERYLFHSIPFDLPNGLNGSTDPNVFRPSNRTWRIYPSTIYTFGLSDDILAPSDYIGSYNADLAVFRPSNGTWYIGKEYQNAGTNFLAIQWGTSGDIPAPADYNSDGKSDVAVFRPSDGTWYINYIADGSYEIQRWGLNGDKPAPGDYDGDGKYDIAVFRPSDGNWYIRRSSDGGATILHFGSNGDIPVQEDYDGDGKFDVAVYRPSTGVWYILKSSDGDFWAVQWGLPNDIPAPGNYDANSGDLRANITVWRPSNGNWYILNNDFASMHFYTFGSPDDKPLPGKY